MKISALITAVIMLATASHAAIYKWVDESGTTHFSDKPYSNKAEKVEIQGTGISVDQPTAPSVPAAVQQEAQQGTHAMPPAPIDKSNPPDKKKVITEDDYRISASVGKLGADMLSISGRVSSGPVCKDMVITATARNENGLSAAITQNTSKTTSHGSTLFEGTVKVSGSRDDLSFWKIDSVTIRCNDQ